MNIPCKISVAPGTAIFLYWLKSFFLALSVVGITKYAVGDGGWINYLLIVSPFLILVVINLIRTISAEANK